MSSQRLIFFSPNGQSKSKKNRFVLLRKDGAPNEAALRRTKDLMNKAVADANVRGYESLIPSIALPDLDDRHVMAAAIKARADAIVTFNLKDFPASVLRPFDLEAVHPDDFISSQMDLADAAVIRASTKCCRRLLTPKKSGKEYLDALQKKQLPKTVDALRPYEEIICPSPFT